jgi:hypothetical protein
VALTTTAEGLGAIGSGSTAATSLQPLGKLPTALPLNVSTEPTGVAKTRDHQGQDDAETMHGLFHFVFPGGHFFLLAGFFGASVRGTLQHGRANPHSGSC